MVAVMRPINEKKLIPTPAKKGIKPVWGESNVPKPYPSEAIIMVDPIRNHIAPLTWSLFIRAINNPNFSFPYFKLSKGIAFHILPRVSKLPY
jgi:hypothetical protein